MNTSRSKSTSKDSAEKITEIQGKWTIKNTIVTGAVSIVTSLITLFGTSGALRGASEQLKDSTTKAETLTQIVQSSVPLGTIITSILPPAEFERQTGSSVQDSADKGVWVLADGREVRGSAFTKITGESRVPNLSEFSLQDTHVISGNIKNSESLLENLDKDATAREWNWIISLREANPRTPFVEWEQRLQRLFVSSDDPRKISATAQIYNAKTGDFAPESPATVNYLGVSLSTQKVYWYIKIN